MLEALKHTGSEATLLKSSKTVLQAALEVVHIIRLNKTP